MSSAHTKSLLNALTPLDLKQLSRPQKIELIREHRASRARSAASVIFFLATDILAGGTGGLSATELYDLYEQVLVASLECGRVAKARLYLNLLERRFGRKSNRVQHLRGLCLEAEGETEDAKKLYAAVRRASPTDDFCIHRLCALLKSEGRFKEAIAVLEEEAVYEDEEEKKHTFFEVHRGDAAAAYLELSNLHYLCGNLPRAMHYAEEYALFNLDSYFARCRLAELAYASNDLDRATAEYSQSLLLNTESNNSRAAYGLWQTASQALRLDSSGVRKLDAGKKAQAEELREMAGDTLRAMYASSAMLGSLDAFIHREAEAENA